MRRSRRKMDAALKAKIVLEALRKQASVAELAGRHLVPADQVYAWNEQLLDNAALVFDARAGAKGEERADGEKSEHFAKIGQLTVERETLHSGAGPPHLHGVLSAAAVRRHGALRPSDLYRGGA